MKRTIAIVAALLVLMVRAPVSAQTNPLIGGWTEDERASLLHLREAMDSVLDLVEAECGVAGTETACINVVQGYLDLTQSAGWLFHVNVNPNDSSGETLLAGPRSGVVSKAWFELNRAKYEMGKASATFSTNAHYENAFDEIDLIDTTLSYSTPFPLTYPKQFGPHGDYSAAQKSLWGFSQYGSGAMKEWLAGMLAVDTSHRDAVLDILDQRGVEMTATQRTAVTADLDARFTKPELPACPNVFRGLSRAFRRGQVHTWFMSAHVIDPTPEFGAYMTDFVAALPVDHVARRALVEIALISGVNGEQGAAYAMRIAGASAGACLADEMPHLATFLLRYSDSWETGADDWNGHFEKIEN